MSGSDGANCSKFVENIILKHPFKDVWRRSASSRFNDTKETNLIILSGTCWIPKIMDPLLGGRMCHVQENKQYKTTSKILLKISDTRRLKEWPSKKEVRFTQNCPLGRKEGRALEAAAACVRPQAPFFPASLNAQLQVQRPWQWTAWREGRQV